MTEKVPSGLQEYTANGPKWRGVVMWLFLGQRIRPLWIMVALGFLFFSGFRVGLLITNWEAVGALYAGEIARCLTLGMRFDAMPIGYGLLPMVLVLSLAPGSAFERPGFRRAITVYAATIVTLVASVEVIGVAFFLHFGGRLNYMATIHARHPQELVWFIWRKYPLLLFVTGQVAVFLASRVFFSWAFWRGRRPGNNLPLRLAFVSVLTALCVLACRGGVDHHPLRRGSAYFSLNNLVNQLTMNNFYTFFYAAVSTMDDEQNGEMDFSFPSLQKAVEVVKEMLKEDDVEWLRHESNSLWRRISTGRQRRDYNVVVIMMEGMAGEAVGVLGNSPSHTPCFDKLCGEGIYFERMFALGQRTNRGMVSVLCGHTDLAGKTILMQERAVGKFLTLPGILRNRGYRTLFIYGGDPGFDNMDVFFSSNGIETIIGQKQMGSEELAGNWGLPDEVILAKADETFRKLHEANEKFFATVLTVSNHEPYEVPPGRVKLLPVDKEENLSLNAYRYADWALGEFFRKVREAPYFKQTIFVLVSDHGRFPDASRIIDVPSHHIPCLIYGPDIVKPGRVRTVVSQIDIAPTVLALLGGQYEHCFLGRDVLSVAEESGFALLCEDDRLAFVQGSEALVLRPGQEPLLFRTDPREMKVVNSDAADAEQAEVMRGRVLSLYLIGRELYLNGSYHRPAEAIEP